MKLGTSPKAVMAIALVVMLGLLFGAVGYLMNHSVAPPLNNSEKIYTVDEVLKIRDTNPESLKDKSILLKAYAVDATLGIGCEDFYILTDYENVDFYRDYIKRYTEGKTTEEEKIKFDSIPRLEAAVRTVIPGGITEYAIFIGHFYDKWQVRHCNNGWTRFTITGKKEELAVPVKNVTIITDKTEYERGENIKITVKNDLDKKMRIGFPPYSIEKFDNGVWIEIKTVFCPCEALCKPGASIVQPNGITEYQWNQKESWCSDPKGISTTISNQVDPGIYRIKTQISNEDGSNRKTIYSNEFMIKEKKEVTITTDKTGYEQGEPVKITIANHQDEPIYTSPYDSFPSTYFISKFDGDKWKRISQNCGCEYTCENGFLMSCPQYVPPAPYFREFKSPFIGEWKQTQCASKNQMCGNKSYTAVIDEQVEIGKYKVGFCYWDKKDIDLTKDVDYTPQDKKKCVEKEFTIKEKSALDPRCGQKVKITGLCEGKLIDDIGYQFNSEIGKCIERAMGGTGCRVESPFTSLEECQMTCEILKAKELSFETIENVNWPGIGEKKNYVIKNKEEWQDVWAEAGHSAIAPIVDFNKEMVVAVFYGVAPTGGYNIEIIKIIESADKLEVFVKETSPGEGCIVTQATTEPRHIIKLQKSDKEIIFNVTRITTNCGAYGH